MAGEAVGGADGCVLFCAHAVWFPPPARFWSSAARSRPKPPTPPAPYQDCTSFVSQALLAGGHRPIKPDNACDKLNDHDVWWYIKHSMLVTKKTEDNIFLSYHSKEKLDEPFYGPGGIKEGNAASTFYSTHIK